MREQRKICWVINYPSLYIHNFLLNKYANTASPLPLPGSAVGMTVNGRRGPWGGGLFEKQAGAGPASSLSHLPWLPWSTGPASLLRYAYTRPADCAFFLSPLGISAFLPSCQGSGSGEDQDSSLVLASVYFLSLISSPSRFWLVYLSSPGL